MVDVLLTEVRPWGGPSCEVLIRANRIAAIEPEDPGRQDHPANRPKTLRTIDGGGRILLPSFSDAHIHLDSTRWGLPFRPHTAGTADAPATLRQQIDNDRAHWRSDSQTVTERATSTLGAVIARGGSHVRSYAQVDADSKLERLTGVLEARQAHLGRAEVSVIAFPQAGIVTEKGMPRLLEQALKAGADAVGGIDPCALDRDPVGHLDVVFSLADKHQVPVDIHLHEPGSLGAFSIELIAERTRAAGMQGRVTISHAFALGRSNDDATVGRLVDLLADNDIAVTTVAPSGIGVLPVRRLTEAGVRLGLGQDGIRDLWSPYGSADLLDRIWQLAFTQGFRADELIEYCVALGTTGGRSVLDPTAPRVTSIADRPGLAVGDPANLVLVPGDTVTAAVMDRGEDRTVIVGGRLIADGGSIVGRRYRQR